MLWFNLHFWFVCTHLRYEPYLWENKRQAYLKHAVVFGFFVQLNRIHVDTVQKLPSNSESNIMRCSTVPRFKYLPIRWAPEEKAVALMLFVSVFSSALNRLDIIFYWILYWFYHYLPDIVGLAKWLHLKYIFCCIVNVSQALHLFSSAPALSAKNADRASVSTSLDDVYSRNSWRSYTNDEISRNNDDENSSLGVAAPFLKSFMQVIISVPWSFAFIFCSRKLTLVQLAFLVFADMLLSDYKKWCWILYAFNLKWRVENVE